MIPARSSSRPRLLLLATTILLPYRIMRCAEAAGASVSVMHTAGAADLRFSNRPEGCYPTDRAVDGAFDPLLAEEINLRARRLGVDMVLPGDAPSTRSLIAVRDLVAPPCFPMPDLDRYDLLNDKWRFQALCAELGIKTPGGVLYADVEALRTDLRLGKVPFTAIAKPLSMDSGIGCVVLNAGTAARQVQRIFYAPILVQDFIAGSDIGASSYCDEGKITAFVAHRYHHQTYATFDDERIYDVVESVARRLALTGVFNFDMRLTPDGRIYFLECNPRFFFKIAMSMLSGINFVALGLPGAQVEHAPVRCGETVVQLPKAALAALATPWKLRARSWDALKFALSDPVPYLREELGIFDEEKARLRFFRKTPSAAARGDWSPGARKVA
ncbi:MAG TPA: ATP-grasp domain-containing protein [Phenylobacterium sp.]|uniref:ATP-grasp domain-containing protein n=1 Tax=Phenylobacterium sp. TaxID=1871053 RepID=UPI002B47E67C|nr:ATP-grasp domain-containing protein [Phenylobacterium sp.]HKR89915.1 ATP-grasp domain-containing protein [Phenylobacterium sp.]